ncbi:MAG: flavodoxin-dependent (E)-4-hydroxy-3-methylbut-2-enyl-diphosphate synthase [candidate division Zixibacteria bacterium]|nr:flavodoxin-dependent (E)-4-hydroxy-3-methylbut-2-enyl-diphosphate synthase [candidate division Zixibacteria bacterium]
MKRKKTKKVWAGKVPIGGGAPISVQSMTKTDTRHVSATIKQIKKLQNAGCDIIRVAVPDTKAASALSKIKREIEIPLVADIHFDYRLALKAIDSGVDKLRINPGNIGAEWKVKQIVKAASDRRIPIRVGVNAGSLPRDLLAKYKKASPPALVEAALRQVRLLEHLNFDDIVISLKSFDVPTTVQAYQLISKRTNYPLHLGITEAGLPLSGSVRSALGIGILLASGIGDTIRVSLTGDPIEEVKVGYEILKSLNLREHGPTIISCPTCGRCEIDIISMTKKVERKVRNIRVPLRIAVMGCVVNGPGEAKDADVGIAGGKGYGLLFRKGKVIGKAKEKDLVEALLDMVQDLIKPRDL